VLEDFNRCPTEPDVVAEAYCMGTLERAAAAAFEDHYIVCRRCAAAVQDEETYVRAMRVAAQTLRPARAAGEDA
jgi:hypothetical protein